MTVVIKSLSDSPVYACGAVEVTSLLSSLSRRGAAIIRVSDFVWK